MKGIKCCLKCEERKQRCHSTCERYNLEKEKHEQEKQWFKKMTQSEMDLYALEQAKIKRQKKYYGRKCYNYPQ